MYSQQVRLENYLKKHSGITTLQAVNELAILRLSQRIIELEQKGLKINRFRVTVKNRFGEDCRVVKYCLVK